MGQIRPSLGKGSNATIPRHMGFSTPICRRAVSDPFCIFFPMMIFWKIKVNYVYLANFKLESGLRIRVTILDRRRRQRVKGTSHLATFWKMSFRHPLGFWKIWYQRNQSQKLETSTKLQFLIFAVYGKNPAQRVSGLHRTDKTDYRF